MFLAAFLDYVSIIILSSLIINVTHFLIIGKRKIENKKPIIIMYLLITT